QSRDASEFSQEFACRALANTGNFRQRSAQPPAGSPPAVESDRKTMCLITNLLDQLQHGRVPVENDRLVLAPENVQNLLFLRDASHWLVCCLEFFPRLGPGQAS